MSGIIIQDQFNIRVESLLLCWTVCLMLISLFFFISLRSKFRLIVVNGSICCIMIAATAAIISRKHDIRNKKTWIGNTGENEFLIVRLKEPTVEKVNSFRGIAEVKSIIRKNYSTPAAGRLIIYFKKDRKPPLPGTDLLINKIPEPVTASGNPGSFDFKSFCLLQGITHQLYVSKENYGVIATGRNNTIENFIQRSRNLVVNCLKKNINGRERGLAEALLIGYKDDLDKDLVQAYSRTGVVHIIAISGMHLALIYAVLMWITSPFRKIKWLRTLVILSGLWIFTLMAGAQASVVRSAVMFTCIALGAVSGRKTSTFNTLGISAFILLCYQPLWLWDVGFQLSYAAVLSILVFYKKIYSLLYVPNKLLDALWKIVAISLAAQVVTTPLTLYYFHQFPLLFILTNLVAVPLSGIILFGEIFLCMVSWHEWFSRVTGYMVDLLIYWMNSYIERINSISFAVWVGFSVSVFQLILMYIIIASFATWLIEKNRKAFVVLLMAVAVFGCFRSSSFIRSRQQQKLIVYNIPKHSATGIISGRTFYLFADSNLYSDKQAFDLNVLPSHIVFRLKKFNYYTSIPEIILPRRRILLFNTSYRFISLRNKIKTDVIILSAGFRQNIFELYKSYSPALIISDPNVSPWKAALWKIQCDSLHIFFHNMREKGAFVMNL